MRCGELTKLQSDIELVLDNALIYNRKDTPIYRLATRIKSQVNPAFSLLQIPSVSGIPDDLQPPLSQLNLLFSREAVEEAIPFEMIVDPVESLFSYEIGKDKPEPEKPKKVRTVNRGRERREREKKEKMSMDGEKEKEKPPRPPRDRKAERARRKERLRLQAEQLKPANQSEFLPRTRGEAARLAEAGVDTPTSADAPGLFTELNPSLASTSIVNSTMAEGETGPVHPKPEIEDAELPLAKRKRSRRETGPVLPIPTTISKPTASEISVVESVSNNDSFKMFNGGWILSPNANRRSASGTGRAGASLEPPTPTKIAPAPAASQPAPRPPRNRNRAKGKGRGKKKASARNAGNRRGRGRTRESTATAERSETREPSEYNLSDLSDLPDDEEEDEDEYEPESENENAHQELEGSPVKPNARKVEKEVEEEDGDVDPEVRALKHLKIKPGQTLEGGTLGESPCI